MDINRTSGKRVSASQRDLVNAGSDQATVRKVWKALAAVVFGLLLSVPGWAQAQYRFIKIDVPEATATAANGNSTHEIVGQFYDADENTHGFVWNKGAPTTIDVTGAVFTILNGINAAGDVMGTYGDGERNHAFVMIKGILTTLDPPGDSSSQGGFINAKGEAVGTYRDGNPNPKPPDQVNKRRGFIWRKGMFTNTSINVPGDHPLFGTVALGINDIGEIVGNYVHEDDKIIPGNPDTTPPIPPIPEHRHGFLRSRTGVFTTIDVPDADYTIAQGINNAGTIVGAYFVSVNSVADLDHPHGFVLSNGVFTTVDVPDERGQAQFTQIFSINAKGEIVGTYFDADGVQHGFLGIPVR
jgi:uncharacterized membrane protein